MINDVIINKSQVIKRCLDRINEEYKGDVQNLHNYTKQDSIILNLQRACEAAIDLAMHIIAEKNLGIPQSSRQAFDLLCQYNIIEKELAERLKAMVGFRNIAVHDYQTINLNIIQKIIEYHLGDFKIFTNKLLQMSQNSNNNFL
ncbi:type VII toxin-antitoxin system HepT family RNase toxin [Desulfotomaculum sp. 1211_IL3151]|uniref:type VII toxin-antitoxin system HepT family RNase toxin n=1 Tax=Desulfotomaculum sp. 1211_IL3151 TaxID=3084055 RepID=UPI002FD98868